MSSEADINLIIENTANKVYREYVAKCRTPGCKLVVGLVLIRAGMYIITEAINESIEEMSRAIEKLKQNFGNR